MKIVLATNNKNKLREFREILEPMGFEVLSQAEAGADIEVDETGATFEENAYLKAKGVYDLLHIPVIADDSGLMVDFLDGAPGVYSARYAEPGHRCERILRELEGVADEKRTAHFVCCICYIDGNGGKHTVQGRCSGRIGYEKKGENGFGYDPIFIPDEADGRTFAELTADEKNSMSHRSRAIAAFKEVIIC